MATQAKLRENLPVILMVVVAILIPLFALLSGFCNVDALDSLGKENLARLLATMTFPLTGVLLFVLTEALKLRTVYNQPGCEVTPRVIWYTVMCWASALAIVGCATTGILSLRYITTAATADVLLVSALCLVLSILILLIFNVLLFFTYTLTRRKI